MKKCNNIEEKKIMVAIRTFDFIGAVTWCIHFHIAVLLWSCKTWIFISLQYKRERNQWSERKDCGSPIQDFQTRAHDQEAEIQRVRVSTTVFRRKKISTRCKFDNFIYDKFMTYIYLLTVNNLRWTHFKCFSRWGEIHIIILCSRKVFLSL